METVSAIIKRDEGRGLRCPHNVYRSITAHVELLNICEGPEDLPKMHYTIIPILYE